MKKALLLAVSLVVVLFGQSKIAPDLQLAPGASQRVIVEFVGRPNLQTAYRMPWDARGRFVVSELRATANRSQARAAGYLNSRGLRFNSLWASNSIGLSADLDAVQAIATLPEVVRISPDRIYPLIEPAPASGAIPGGNIQTVEWSIAKVRAPEVWPTTKGAGIVVGVIDTGMEYTHPAFTKQYRGNLGSGQFSHLGNWFDPANICGPPGSPPCDNQSHGTHVTGTILGDDGAGNQIGAAPEAKHIHCKGCEIPGCSSSSLLACMQFMLDPFDDGSGNGRPHIVSNSWATGGTDRLFQSSVQAWRAAGVLPIFANGNSGPLCNTVGAPASYPESIGVGATDASDVIGSFSSRGQSPLGPVKPDLVAPGLFIRSSTLGGSYAVKSGTSMATPLVSGVVALLLAGAPSYIGNVPAVESLLRSTSVHYTTSETCGGLPAGYIPNNTYGYGRIDAKVLVDTARNGGTPPPPPPPPPSPTLTILTPQDGQVFECQNYDLVRVLWSGTAIDPLDGDISQKIQWFVYNQAIGTGASIEKLYVCQDTTQPVDALVVNSLVQIDTERVAFTIRRIGVPPPPPPPQCSDGIDNDGDGLVDFPADPGCSSTADNDESNAPPPPPNTPPAITITSPAPGASLFCPVTVRFAASASDAEDGALSNSVQWSEDGVIFATGASVTKRYGCGHLGSHIVTARVVDRPGASASAEIRFSIQKR